ncbi:hypothetical protein CWE13_08205 [Aliidiomarina shirensis]|uniref:NADPH--hemoprotein reductase n=1 Tax=Aliidiomarina shirensis TaxID=1048642 RepID=A0A432WSS7_9GAMM|nr:NADPH cytochrome P450 oxidoreductase family protein [Aliidiomarina shirensis]RUO36819.1 hypothetical protein CWE13_08205 [Aliidiomarina shirensis]
MFSANADVTSIGPDMLSGSVLFALALFTGWAFFSWWAFRAHQRSSVKFNPVVDTQHGNADGKMYSQKISQAQVLVVYASATGQSRKLATDYVAHINNTKFVCCDFNDFCNLYNHANHPTLKYVLFIASTAGDGEAPETVAKSWQALQQSGLQLPRRVCTATLALGDRNYPQYCAFGLALAVWLRREGFTELFPPVTVDKLQRFDIERWYEQLAQVPELSVVESIPTADIWRLTHREELNPGSNGSPLYHLAFKPTLGTLPTWMPGDVVDVQLPDGSARTYSIASLPEDGAIELVVRQVQLPNQQLGVGSGWLTERIDGGSQIQLEIRSYPQFHPPEASQPLILIGAGSGYAGLRAHLKHRAKTPGTRQWLIYGERNRINDAIFIKETQALRELGTLLTTNRVYSRDGISNGDISCDIGNERYVQDVIRNQKARLQQWLMAGACIYICGSKQMGDEVLKAVAAVTGESVFQLLQSQNRIKAELY